MARSLLAGFVAALLAGEAGAAALRRAAVANVPKGECYECEVTCFEDCLLKYEREIIDADTKDAKDRARAKRKAAAAKGKLVQTSSSDDYPEANRTRIFSWRTRGGPTRSEEASAVSAMVGRYTECLEAEKCQGHSVLGQTSFNPWAQRARENPACKKPEPKHGKKGALVETSSCSKPANNTCSDSCSLKALASETEEPAEPALVQSKAFPLHPVKIHSFDTGKQMLEMCMKSCLAATCGCQDAPGFEAISKLGAQIKANDERGDPVADTPPEYNYRPAFKDECGGGAANIKITNGLFVTLAGGWKEVCTEDMLKGVMVKDTKKGMKKCKSPAPEDFEYGCFWNEKKGSCVWGLKPIVRCSVRFMSDKK